MADVTVLCAADLHLGRRSSRLPALESGARLSPAEAWLDLVERAVTDRVSLVVLAGDVVDQYNRSYEAWGPLQGGVRALEAAGIPVVAVAGNHDHDTLHDLAADTGGGNLTVLGRGGVWERWTLTGDEGEPLLHVDGWSFPDGRWPADPTESYDPASLGGATGVPILGLLHAELDQTGSPYGPVSAARLRSLPVAAWVLGHIHVPYLSEGSGAPAILYPGSLQALDPGETGPHGACLIELRGKQTPTFRRIALSGARYDTVEVDVTGLEDAAALNAAVRRSLQQHLNHLGEELTGPLKMVHCRVRLTGRTPLHGRIEDALDGLGAVDISAESGLRLIADPRPIIDTLPSVELEELARASDSPGLLARLLLELDAEPAAGRGELAGAASKAAARAAAAVAQKSHYATANLESVEVGADSDRVREGVRRQAARLLDALMAQKEAS